MIDVKGKLVDDRPCNVKGKSRSKAASEGCSGSDFEEWGPSPPGLESDSCTWADCCPCLPPEPLIAIVGSGP